MSTGPQMSTADLLAELTSRDAGRVWAAVHAVIRLPEEQRRALAVHLGEIRRATQGLDLGGGLFPNREHLRHALRVLTAARRGLCPCTLYPHWLFYNPEEEQAAGRVELLSRSAPDWHMTYGCRCLACGTEYDVEQGEYHYTWWQWRPRRPAA